MKWQRRKKSGTDTKTYATVKAYVTKKLTEKKYDDNDNFSFANSTKSELVDLCNKYKIHYIDVPATDRRIAVLNSTNNDNVAMIEDDLMIRVLFNNTTFREKSSTRNPFVPTLKELKIGITRYCIERESNSPNWKLRHERLRSYASTTANNRQRNKRRRSALIAKLIDTRRRMEKFCTSSLQQYNITHLCKLTLFDMIKLLEKTGKVRCELIASMHKVRLLGNKATHSIDTLPGTEVITSTILYYDNQRQFYFNEIKRL